MNFTQYISELTLVAHISHISPSSIPGTLWEYYVQYLWLYEPDSWVARIAYSCRVLAILVSLPIIILGLLDISSYGIARTLGVIDDVKASTSDKSTVAISTPSIQVIDATSSSSESAFSDSDLDSMTDHKLHNRIRSPLSDSNDKLLPSQPPVFYASEGNSLSLSGVGVFSPAASQPSSPTIKSGAENLRYRTHQLLSTTE